MDEWMDEWNGMDGWMMDGWMDGWRWMDGEWNG